MESVCQSTNLTIMNDSRAAGTAPCITSPHGKTNDGGMPEAVARNRGWDLPYISRPATSSHALGADVGIVPAPFSVPALFSPTCHSVTDVVEHL